MIDSLAKNFKMRFTDIRSHIVSTYVFENPLSVEVSDPPKKSCILNVLNCNVTQFFVSSFN
jgi:hypothetical protein